MFNGNNSKNIIDRDAIHIELVDNEVNKIIIPKELNIELNKEELLQIDYQLYLSKQIIEKEYIFYDKSKNIWIGSLQEEDQIHNKDLSYQIELVDEVTESCRTTAKSPFKWTVSVEKYSYYSFPPRAPFVDYKEPPNDYRYIAKDIERPLKEPINFQAESKGYILKFNSS